MSQSSAVLVPVETGRDFPSILASVAESIEIGSTSVSEFGSNLERESALFHTPGQCTTVMLNCDRKSLIRITALLIELCINLRFK